MQTHGIARGGDVEILSVVREIGAHPKWIGTEYADRICDGFRRLLGVERFAQYNDITLTETLEAISAMVDAREINATTGDVVLNYFVDAANSTYPKHAALGPGASVSFSLDRSFGWEGQAVLLSVKVARAAERERNPAAFVKEKRDL